MATTNDNNSGNVGIAFALVIGAGAATAIGASVVFFPCIVKLASRRTLAASLGLSAGVMTYVSFVEIFQKSYLSFSQDGHDPAREAYIYATVCFFSGVIIMLILNATVTWLLGGHHHHNHDGECGEKITGSSIVSNSDAEDEEEEESKSSNIMGDGPIMESAEAMAPCACCSDDPAADLDTYQKMAREMEELEKREHRDCQGDDCQGDDCQGDDCCEKPKVKETKRKVEWAARDPEQDDEEEGAQTDDANADENPQETRRLMRMSINTALAIGIHNFPEGLATFVAAMADPAVGVVLAVAIAIHNIPEGLCVALPIYYATGNKWKAFMWGCLSGASEPLAALLGWAVLANTMSNSVYAIMFGIVAGMMVIISVKELLPTAHRYDPEDTVVTYAFMLGMAILALSLVLFKV